MTSLCNSDLYTLFEIRCLIGIMHAVNGPVAHLVERTHGMREVRSSSLRRSTSMEKSTRMGAFSIRGPAESKLLCFRGDSKGGGIINRLGRTRRLIAEPG